MIHAGVPFKPPGRFLYSATWVLRGRPRIYSSPLYPSIPANTKAHIWLPSESEDTPKEGGKTINTIDDILYPGSQDKFSVYEIGSGVYRFSGYYKN
jgi:hypothetical protein